MKRILFFLVVLTLSCDFGQASEAQELPVNSKITHVTVFLKGAHVTRDGKIDLSQGKHDLVFRSLSSDIQPNSIQVKGEGDFIILSVKHRLNYLEHTDEESGLKALRNKLESLKQEKENISVQLQVLSGEENMLKKNQSIGGSQSWIKVAELVTAVDFFRKKLAGNLKQQLQVKKQIKQKDDEIKQVALQINDYTREQKKATSEVVVTVSADKEQKAVFFLSYYVDQAGWRPEYDIRVQDITKQVEVNYKAYVKQTTGEPWDNVGITLSTGNPALGGTKPELSTWYLDYRPLPPVTYKKYDKGVSRKSAMTKMETTAAAAVASMTSTVQRQTTTQFRIQIPYTIHSDNREQVVIIKNLSLPAVYAYYVVPKLDRDAFLVAKVSDWGKYNLLTGKMNLFFEGTYVGNSYLNVASAKDTLSLSLGRDKGIKIERKKLVDFSKRQIIGGNIKEMHGWNISVLNSKNVPVHLYIEEQIPVSKRKEIVVEPVDISGAYVNTTTGKCVWDVYLKPGESGKITLTFSVKYPKNHQVFID